MAFELTALSQKHLDYFQSLKGKGGHLADGIFIAEGPKIVSHVLASNCEVPYALLTPEFFEKYQSLFAEREGITHVHLAGKGEMEKIVGYPLHQGVMLAAKIPEEKPLEQLVRARPVTLVALEGIADAENMGTLIRTAAAFGATAVAIDATCCHPFLRRSVRVSMGTVVNVPIVRVSSIGELITQLQQIKPVQIVAAALEEKSCDLRDVIWERDVAILFGAEGTGLTSAALKQTDSIAHVSMAPGIDSLNVGVACGIFLHHRTMNL